MEPTKPRKIEALELLAREMVGDGKSPGLFFVTDRGVVVTVTRSFDVAYAEWQLLADARPLRECALEGRKYGVIADVSPDSDDPGSRLVRCDDSREFRRDHAA